MLPRAAARCGPRPTSTASSPTRAASCTRSPSRRGIAALEAAGQRPSPVSLAAAALGVVASAWGLRTLLPPGTLRVRRGVAAPIAMRGLLAGAFFGMESVIPLSLTVQHGFNATQAGLPLACSGLTWALGFLVAGTRGGRRCGRPEPPVRLIRRGFAFVALAAGAVAAVGAARGAGVADLPGVGPGRRRCRPDHVDGRRAAAAIHQRPRPRYRFGSPAVVRRRLERGDDRPRRRAGGCGRPLGDRVHRRVHGTRRDDGPGRLDRRARRRARPRASERSPGPSGRADPPPGRRLVGDAVPGSRSDDAHAARGHRGRQRSSGRARQPVVAAHGRAGAPGGTSRRPASNWPTASARARPR